MKPRNKDMQDTKAEKMVAMKLLRNYCPGGRYEIVGWHRPALQRKGPSGQIETTRAAEFIRGEMADPPYPGVGFDGKVWAGTVIKLGETEARAVKDKRIAELEFAD
jgi:hypothetical protein